MRAFGEWEYFMRPNMDRPISLGEDVVTCYEIAKQAMVILGNFHANFWMDQEFVSKRPWLARQEYFVGEN